MQLLIFCCAAAQVKAPGCAAGGGGAAAVLVTEASSVSYGIGGRWRCSWPSRRAVPGTRVFLKQVRELHEARAAASDVVAPRWPAAVWMMRPRSIAALRAARAAPPIPAVDLMHFFCWRPVRAAAGAKCQRILPTPTLFVKFWTSRRELPRRAAGWKPFMNRWRPHCRARRRHRAATLIVWAAGADRRRAQREPAPIRQHLLGRRSIDALPDLEGGERPLREPRDARRPPTPESYF